MIHMLKFLQTLAIILFSTTAVLAKQNVFPALYQVTNVATNDVLNVRQGTDASSPILGTILPYDFVEVLRVSADGKWGLVGLSEGNGWASMQYLAREVGQQYTEETPLSLNCFGTEPFWSLDLSTNIDVNVFSQMGSEPLTLPSTHGGVHGGVDAYSYPIKLVQDGGELNAVIFRRQCSDGMSDREYGFEIYAFLSGNLITEPFPRMLNGCCTLGIEDEQ